MAIAFGAVGTQSGQASGTTITPALPAGLAVGNLIISVAAVKNNSTLTWPAGWTKVSQTNSGASWTVAWAWRINVTGVTAPAITIGTSAAATAQCWSYTGQDQFGPIGRVGAAGTGTTSPHTCNGSATTRTNSFNLYIDACAAATALTNPTSTTPATYTQRSATTNATSVTSISLGDGSVATQGSVTSNLSSTGGAAAYVEWQIEILAPMPPDTDIQHLNELNPHIARGDLGWQFDRFWWQAPFIPPIWMPGVADYPLTPAVQPIDQTWTWQYNLNLIGQDRMAVRQQDWPLPIQPFRLEQTWVVNLLENTLAVVPAGLPNLLNQFDWPLPRAPLQPALSWSWSYNLNLIGQDAMLVGDQRYELAPIWPPYVNQLRTWSWSYNLNLIGRDRMIAGKQSYDLTQDQRPPWPIDLRSWAWRYNLNLIGKDAMLTGEQVTDLAPAQKPYEQTQLHSWQWSYNLNLIGQDARLVGQQVWERPTLPIPPALTWIEGPQYELIAKPYAQYDWPNPIAPYRLEQTWTWAYNQNLIGQDAMIKSSQITDLPPRDFARLLQTWIQNTNLALLTAPPVVQVTIGQREWPVPRGAEPDWRRSWEWSYNKNLIGQDQFPSRQFDWPNPQTPQQAIQTWINQTNLLLTTAPTKPFTQTDWPLPPAPQQAALGWAWSYNLNLIGQDRMLTGAQITDLPPRDFARLLQTWIQSVSLALTAKPFAQYDWPNPTPFARDPTLAAWLGRYILELIGQDQLPFRQGDWPNPTLPDQFATLRGAWSLSLNLALNQMAPQLLAPLFMRNQDWPVPLGPIQPNRGFVFGFNPNLPPTPPPPTGPAVYNKPMLAGPGYLNVIPGEKPS
jgi:hypothetical protein